MVTAVVLMKAETDKVPELAEQLTDLEGVSEVFSVAGQYDLVALVRVRENEDLARVISGQVRKLPGITSSETLIDGRLGAGYLYYWMKRAAGRIPPPREEVWT